MSRLVRTVVAVAAAALVLAGCGFHGVYSLPLPGAAGTGAHTYTVGVQLADVLDLVPYSAVKVNGATVGHVKSISVQGHHALVECQLPDSVVLPANAIARVEQTSVLGEKFVEIEPPSGIAPTGRLHDGDTITLSRTATDATVEEVLGALSMLLNGGGVNQLHTITHELSTALDGHTGAARDLLGRLSDFTSGLDRQKGAILHAIDGLDRLAGVVRNQESSLTNAIDTMPAALQILVDDRHQLVHMLTAVKHLGNVAGHVINASENDLVANLRNLQPTLGRLARVGKLIPQVLQVLITYPTADTVEQEYFGDYGNLALTIDVSAKSLLHTFGPMFPGLNLTTKHHRHRHRSGGNGGSTSPVPVPTPSLPSLPPLPGLTRWAPGTNINGLLLGAVS
jgi:phospholipid/cholesterol/gamma-HCH transport system substrate-binding protein